MCTYVVLILKYSADVTIVKNPVPVGNLAKVSMTSALAIISWFCYHFTPLANLIYSYSFKP